MKHDPVILDLGTIIGNISRHGDGRWDDVMGLDIPGLAEVESETDRDDIEADFLKAHGNDLFRVSWPEHVTVPRFNSDASYRPA